MCCVALVLALVPARCARARAPALPLYCFFWVFFGGEQFQRTPAPPKPRSRLQRENPEHEHEHRRRFLCAARASRLGLTQPHDPKKRKKNTPSGQ